jgi:hypothetical protein
MRPPFCSECGKTAHEENCQKCWPHCDRYHDDKCTAFCRKCVGIGHSWKHCHLFVPDSNPQRRRRRRGQKIPPSIYVGKVQIIVPVLNARPVTSPDKLNADILNQLKVALADLPHQGVSVPARVTMKNVNITTNLVTPSPASVAAAAPGVKVVPKDTPLMERVQRPPTGPRSNASALQPQVSQQVYAEAYLSQYEFAQSGYTQPEHGPRSFGQPSFGPSPFTFEPRYEFHPIRSWPCTGNELRLSTRL